MDKFKQTELSLSDGQFVQGLNTNNSISVTNAVEDNYKNYYTIYAKYNQGNFNANDSILLSDMVKLCPGIDGTIVYQARALYNFIFKTIVVYLEDCSETTTLNSRFISNAKEDKNFNKNIWNVDLFPNPTSRELTIVSKFETENLVIIIKDVTDKIVYKQSLVTSNFISKLDLHLTGGVYLISMTNSNNEIITKKLVITD